MWWSFVPAFDGYLCGKYNIRMNYELAVIEAIAEDWKQIQQNLPQNSCILAGRVASEVLTDRNIDHEVVPIAAVVENHAMRAVHMTGVMNDDAWNVCCGEFMNVEQPPETGSWTGHLVVVTDNYFIDLTATQFARPAKQINIDSPLIAKLDDLQTYEIPLYDKNTIWIGFQLPAGGRYLFQPQLGNQRYKTGPDWQRGYKSFAGSMIRNVRRAIGNEFLNYVEGL